MPDRVIELPELAATARLAAAAAVEARPGDAILLQGPLGAGKTEFARAFLRAASGDPALEVPSPTFTLVQSYETRLGPVHHFDLWRLDGPDGLLELGWDDSRDGVVLVEWPERLGRLRPAEALTVMLTHAGEARRATLQGWPERVERVLGRARQASLAAFLTQHGYATARTAPLAQDASFRRYLRLSGGPRPAVLMDAPPPEDVRPFLRIAEHLRGAGIAVPQIFAADAAAGFVLEEDLGDALVSSALDGGCNAAALQEMFDTTVDVLATMQRAGLPSGLPEWEAAAMARATLDPLLEWWWPAALSGPPPDAARRDFATALATLLRPLQDAPAVFVHRDFFAGNLIWLPEREAVKRIGVLDFQSAAAGHPAYDLVSLIQDARRDLPDWLEERSVARFLAARPELNREQFATAFAICAAQRHLRVACQWVRLALRDHRPQYLVHGPRTWRRLATALRHPAAAPLKEVMDRWIPPESRGNPPGVETGA